MRDFIPYCGRPAIPEFLNWNHSPVLAFLSLIVLFLYVRSRKGKVDSKTVIFVTGCIVFDLCFLSPLCPLGVALFSARATEHVMLVLVAAPLLAFGLAPPRFRAGFLSVLVAAFAFACLVWLWHSPRLYDATLQSNLVFWLMNATMMGSAVWFWISILSSDGLAALAGVSFIGLEMSLLGALIAFAKAPFYSVHALTTAPWGLSQMDDQRLGGLIMWVPAGLLGLSFSAIALFQWLSSLSAVAHRRRSLLQD